MAMLSSPSATLLLQKNMPVAVTSTPSVFLGGDLPDAASVEMVMPVMVTLVSPLTQMCSSGEFVSLMPLIWTRVTLPRFTSCGRVTDELAAKASHQACPWPSIVPEPVTAMSCVLPPVVVMKAGGGDGYVPYGSIFSVAPEASWRLVPLPIWIGPERNVPDGMTTVPPPALEAAVSAAWSVLVLSVLSSPTTP